MANAFVAELDIVEQVFRTLPRHVAVADFIQKLCQHEFTQADANVVSTAVSVSAFPDGLKHEMHIAIYGKPARRTAQQHYEHIVSEFYTQGQWDHENMGDHTIMHMIVGHAYHLLLRSPTESTYKFLVAMFLLQTTGFESAIDMDAHKKLALVAHFKRILTGMTRKNTPSRSTLFDLPTHPSALSQELYDDVYREGEPPITCDCICEINAIAESIKVRTSGLQHMRHRQIAQTPAVDAASLTNPMQLMQVMMQMMQSQGQQNNGQPDQNVEIQYTNSNLRADGAPIRPRLRLRDVEEAPPPKRKARVEDAVGNIASALKRPKVIGNAVEACSDNDEVDDEDTGSDNDEVGSDIPINKKPAAATKKKACPIKVAKKPAAPIDKKVLSSKAVKWPKLGCAKCRGASTGCKKCKDIDFSGERYQRVD
jgi:hypothetical protein